MSTEYRLTDDLYIDERSNKFRFSGLNPNKEVDADWESNELTPDELQKVIVELIKVLSYYSDDSDETLRRFNVNYSDTM